MQTYLLHEKLAMAVLESIMEKGIVPIFPKVIC